MNFKRSLLTTKAKDNFSKSSQSSYWDGNMVLTNQHRQTISSQAQNVELGDEKDKLLLKTKQGDTSTFVES